MKLILKGEPKSTQHCYKYTCRGKFASCYMDKKCKDIKEAYQWEAKSQWKQEPLKGDVKLEVRLFFGTKRKADIDNFNKLWGDALSGIVYEDDSQITELHLSKSYCKENPRIEIEILK